MIHSCHQNSRRPQNPHKRRRQADACARAPLHDRAARLRSAPVLARDQGRRRRRARLSRRRVVPKLGCVQAIPARARHVMGRHWPESGPGMQARAVSETYHTRHAAAHPQQQSASSQHSSGAADAPDTPPASEHASVLSALLAAMLPELILLNAFPSTQMHAPAQGAPSTRSSPRREACRARYATRHCTRPGAWLRQQAVSGGAGERCHALVAHARRPRVCPRRRSARGQLRRPPDRRRRSPARTARRRRRWARCSAICGAVSLPSHRCRHPTWPV